MIQDQRVIKTSRQRSNRVRSAAANDRKRKSLRCHLLELPAELRCHIWAFTVVAWPPASLSRWDGDKQQMIHVANKISVRIDKLNLPLPPSLTRVCRLIRLEALPIYYSDNVFEFWRPWQNWDFSLFRNWLIALGPQRTLWLNHVVLMYKQDYELETDVEQALRDEGFALKDGVIATRQELTEYEMKYEQLGLPRRFGAQRRRY